MSSSSLPRILFVQPFSIASASSGGGGRILRSLIQYQPIAKRSINSDFFKGTPFDWIEEEHLPIRPSLGRLDHSRFVYLGYYLEIMGRGYFRRKLDARMDAWLPDVVHVLAHGSSEFFIAWELAREKGQRVVMSIHDDLRYNLPEGHPFRKKSEAKLALAWRDVDHVFVISEELGQEYCRRYGTRPFEIITDGLQQKAEALRAGVQNRLHVYFMGLFHYSYRDNLVALTRALAQLKARQPELEISLTMRCQSLPSGLPLKIEPRVLPWADQATIDRDLETADVLYFPLPFDAIHQNFVQFSLSTKMVTYLGTGLPILYHGPSESAASHMLEQNGAAFLWHNSDQDQAVKLFEDMGQPQVREQVCRQALKLADKSFRLDVLRERFLKGLLGT